MKKDPRIEIFKDKKGEFRFRVVASNGEIVCQSEGYTTKAKCRKGIKILSGIFMFVNMLGIAYNDLTI